MQDPAEQEDRKDQRGQSNIEYVLIIAVIACALLFLMTQFGDTLTGMFTSRADVIADTDALDFEHPGVAAKTDEVEAEEEGEAEGTVAAKKHKEMPEPIVVPEEQSFLSRILPYVLLVLVGILMIAILVIKIKQRHLLRDLKQAEEGQAMTETALSLPVVLLFVFAIMQLGLAYHALFMVHLASFYAARSAIVWIPDESGDGKNTITISSSDPKFSKMLNAARLPCVPISAMVNSLISGIDYTGQPAGSQSDITNFIDSVLGSIIDITDLIDAINSVLNALNIDVGDNIFLRMAAKYAYAYVCTSVDLMQEGTLTPIEVGQTAAFSENGPVTVRVNFYYKLDMPLVGAILGQRIFFPSNLGDFGVGDIFSGGASTYYGHGHSHVSVKKSLALKGWFLKISCMTTLSNEGFNGLD